MAGRPEKSKTVKRDQCEVHPSRCACGSTERKPYTGTPHVQEYSGINNGKEYTHIVRRVTKCARCGQARRDLSYENRVDTKR